MKIGLHAFLLLTLLSAGMHACSKNDEVAITLSLSSGNYRGAWNSSTPTATFSNLAISAKINEVSNGKFEGSFYISNNFTSCCGGASDGTISFTVKEEKITDFIWDDTIPGCTGTFIGTGTIISTNNLRIDITGTDCDGDHTGHFSLSQ